jgi:anti-sigma-K factor RskA
VASEPSHEEVRELLAAYVLGAVDPDEDRVVTAHLRSCDECAAAVERLSAGAQTLGAATPEEAPPQGFAERVMAQARGENVVPIGPARTGRRSLAPVLAVAAAVVVAAIAGGMLLWGPRDDREVAADVLRRTDGVALEGKGGEARMVPEDGGLLFAAEGLEDLPQGRTYQLWLIDCPDDAGALGPCATISLGTFEPKDGTAVVDIDRGMGGAEQAAVTVEPEGGSQRPTSDPVLASA